jgi:hypothetical protein
VNAKCNLAGGRISFDRRGVYTAQQFQAPAGCEQVTQARQIRLKLRRTIVANDNGSGGIGLLGVVIGALIVVALGYFFLANRATGPGTSTTVRIEAPKVPGSK